MSTSGKSVDAVAIVCEAFIGSHLRAKINAPDISRVYGLRTLIDSS
jgi:hypothetical protein